MAGIEKWAPACVALVAVLLATSGSAAGPEAATRTDSASVEQVDAWIADLDASQYQTREVATQRLLTAGPIAMDRLLKIANGDAPEPADRAIWILRRLSRSPDNALALAALERLVQLEDRPTIVAKAQTDLTDRSVIACQERLGPLGAEMSSQVDGLQATFIPLLVVRLTDKWHGTPDDLRQLIKLKELRHFRLEGAPVTDEVVRMFAEKDKLEYLQLFDTKATPAAVDAVKVKHPDSVVYVRNSAMLGVAAQSHRDGVEVTTVVQGTAAAVAGIEAGDIIVKLDGHQVPDFDRLTARVAQHQPGEKIAIEIIRNGERMKKEAVLGKRLEIE